jgi:hypothetical protein
VVPTQRRGLRRQPTRHPGKRQPSRLVSMVSTAFCCCICHLPFAHKCHKSPATWRALRSTCSLDPARRAPPPPPLPNVPEFHHSAL